LISDIGRLDKIFRTYIFFKSNSIKNEEIIEIIKNNGPRIIKKAFMSPSEWVLIYYSAAESVEYVKDTAGETAIYAALNLFGEGYIKSIDFNEY
jgi:hypothetical protein